MKNLKKLPTKQLEKFSTIFTQLGLVLVLFIVYLALEHKTEHKTLAVYEPEFTNAIYVEPDTEVRFVKEPKLKPKVEIRKQQFIPDAEIKKGNDDIVETIIDIPDDEPVQLNIDDLITADEPIDDDVPDTVPFLLIENAPVFKGCEGLSKEENKRCFDKKMMRFVQRNFDVDLANELGLRAGKHRIFTQFIIDDTGNVVDIKINAPHIKLKKETQQLIEKLPKFTPGKQRNKAVKVKYALPITFSVN
ncbi:energy transducer TonB [Polaribacter sp. R77954]|uniref:energy transducer TonB n=1 Tax=Polaribacter sp. R77954 TaxID=3093870 RepID=UPI0037C95D34